MAVPATPGAVGRALAVLAGVALGIALAASVGAWRDRPLRRDAVPTPPPPVHGQSAPDTRA